MANAVLIYNAGAGSADDVGADQLAASLRSHGLELTVRELVEDEQPGEVAREVLAKGAKVVIAAGGDGTIEAVAAELIDNPVTFAAIACGTYNNFARSIGLPLDPTEACAAIGRGVVRNIDVGFANNRPFFECAGFGLDAEVFPLGEDIKSGALAQWITFFQRALSYRRQRFALQLDRPLREALVDINSVPGSRSRRRNRRLDEPTLTVKALLLTVSNGPYYGMNFAVAPETRVDDGWLTVSIFRKYNHLELWWHFASIAAGRRPYAPKMIRLRVKRLQVGGRRAVRVHLDGQPVSEWPVDIELRSGVLRLLA